MSLLAGVLECFCVALIAHMGRDRGFRTNESDESTETDTKVL